MRGKLNICSLILEYDTTIAGMLHSSTWANLYPSASVAVPQPGQLQFSSETSEYKQKSKIPANMVAVEIYTGVYFELAGAGNKCQSYVERKVQDS